MEDTRQALPFGTQLCCENGNIYTVCNGNIGRGGSSLIYSATCNNSERIFIIKECFPIHETYCFERKENGSVEASSGADSEKSSLYLEKCFSRLQQECDLGQKIAVNSGRVIAPWENISVSHIIYNDETYLCKRNRFLVMEQYNQKGNFLSDILEECERTRSSRHLLRCSGAPDIHTVASITAEILKALDTVHKAGYIYGDIQMNNLFFVDSRFELGEIGIGHLLDFGSVRALMDDGKTDEIADQEIFSTDGYQAPEILFNNDGHLRLTPASDIFSVGCLMIYLIKGENYRKTHGHQLARTAQKTYISTKELEKRGGNAEILQYLNEILSRALRIDPESRYQNAYEMLEVVLELKALCRPVALNNMNSIIYPDSTALPVPQKTASAEIRKPAQDLTRTPPQTILYGRDQELDSLEKMILENRRLVLVNGLGGIGKSALARKLYNRLRYQYERIGWINYKGNLKDSLNSDINLPQMQDLDDPEQRFDTIYRELRKDRKALLFVDDVTSDSAEDEVLYEMAGWDHLSLVLTSRRESVEGFDPVTVGFLQPDDCVELFYAYYGKKRSEQDLDIVRQLVEWAYYHTLTIELLAKAAKRERSLRDYLERLKENGFQAPRLKVSTLKINNRTVLEHIQMLYRMADFEKGSEKYRILWNLALMPTTDIPVDVEDWIQADVNDFEELIQAGWIENHDDSYYMHALIREIILTNRKDEKIPENIADAFLDYIADNDYFTRTQIYTEKQKRFDIAEQVLFHMCDAECENNHFVVSEVAGAARDLGLYKKAEIYYLKALKIKETILGSDHMSTAATYSNLASLYQDTGRYDEAESYFLKALKISESVLGTDHPSTAATYNNLALLYKDMGRYDEAESYYLKALKISESVLGTDHPSTATTYDNLAGLYQATGRYDEAESYYLKALKIRERILGTDHPDTATTYNNLASLYKDTGRHDEAETYYKKALDIFENVPGAGHPDTATTYNNLALLYLNMGKYTKTETYYKKALDIFENVPGADHPNTATIYNNLALLYLNMGKYTKTETYYKKALDIRERILGTDHPDTATTYNNLAELYRNMKRYADAETYYRNALDIQVRILGTDHPDTATTYNNLALLYYHMRRYEEAETYYKKALDIFENVPSTDHLDTATTYKNLSALYWNMRKYTKAETYYKKALKIRKSVLGTDHPDTATMYKNLAGLYQAMGRYDKSEVYYRKALKIYENVLGTNHPDTATMYKNLAGLYQAMGRYDK